MTTSDGLDWPTLRALLERGDDRAVAAATVALDERQRKALAKPLAEHIKEHRRRLSGGTDGAAGWKRQVRATTALRVAAPAILPGAAAIAAHLTRRDSWIGDPGWTLAAEALLARPEALTDDVVQRIARAVDANDRSLLGLVLELLRRRGLDPPAIPDLVEGWMLSVNTGHGKAMAGPLRADPLTPRMVPLMFSVDGVGNRLAIQPYQRIDWTWPVALAALAKDGTLDRRQLLDGAVGALLRGGTPVVLRGYREVYQAMAPAADEIPTRDLARLLPDTASAVAGLALAELQRAQAAGHLTTAAAVTAARDLLGRTEKKLVTAGLSWLDQLGSDAAEIVPAVTVAFGHSAVDIQRRAVTLALKLAALAPLDPATRATAVVAAEALPADLRARLAAGLGTSTPEREAASDRAAPIVPVKTVAVATVRATASVMRGPIGSAAELAEEVAGLLARPNLMPANDDVEPVALERVLAAVVVLAHADRAGLADALAPVLTRLRIAPGVPARSAATARDGLAAVLGAATGPVGAGDTPVLGIGTIEGERRWRTAVAVQPGPTQVVLHRLHEIAAALAHRPVPALVSTPTANTGALDPIVLLGRLAAAADGGWEPLPYDLEQALLRLPHDVDPSVAARAAMLDSDAGAQLADWLSTGGLADPAVTVVAAAVRRVEYSPRLEFIDVGYLFAAVVAKDTRLDELDPRAARPFPPLPSTMVSLVAGLPAPTEVVTTDHEGLAGWPRCWPGVLPHHRDVIAAHLAARLAVDGRGLGRVLPMLAEADGPVGPGLSLALAYGLGCSHAVDRTGAADALYILAGRGHLDGPTVGEHVGRLVELLVFPLTRAVPVLREVQAAGVDVWPLVRSALRVLLAAPRPVNRLVDLLVLGYEAASAAGARGGFDALAAAAANGTGRLRTEARRLHALLD